jgi:transcriptional regulator with GAF, ATPase, and Fis domain
MASLTIKTPDGKSRSVNLLKRITSIGKGADNDIVVEDASVPETAFAVLYDGAAYRVGGEQSFHVNGKKTDEHQLKANDVVKVGGTELVFSMGDAPLAAPALATRFSRGDSNNPDASTQEQPGVPGRELAALRRLTAFSEHLLQSYDFDRILESLMDEVIEVARADKGFLILMESNQLRVKVARNIQRETIEDAIERVSDSIIAKVVKSQKPLIIADALDDPEFNASESVVNLKLLSVMCAPLMHRGELFGVLYLGNDRLINRFDKKALDTLTIFAAQASLLLQNAMLLDQLRTDRDQLEEQLHEKTFGDLIGTNPSLVEVFTKVKKVATTDISVLITGETGTGKGVFARALHAESRRSDRPFVSLNCAALPEALLESELFGHVRGAFTGAVSERAGLFAEADGGTLFLDEIGEMPLALQPKLLHVLESRTVRPVGASRERPVDFRLVAATHRDLRERVAQGAFRADLLYRLEVVPLHVPPLRERPDDLPPLVEHFLAEACAGHPGSPVRRLSPEVMARLLDFDWPGNVRELQHLLTRLVVLGRSAEVTASELPATLAPRAAAAGFGGEVVPIRELQARYAAWALTRFGGHRTRTAEALGVDLKTLAKWLTLPEREGAAAGKAGGQA